MLARRVDEKKLQYIILQSIFFLGNQIFLRIKEPYGGIIWLLTPSDWFKSLWNKKTSFSLSDLRVTQTGHVYAYMHAYDRRMGIPIHSFFFHKSLETRVAFPH